MRLYFLPFSLFINVNKPKGILIIVFLPSPPLLLYIFSARLQCKSGGGWGVGEKEKKATLPVTFSHLPPPHPLLLLFHLHFHFLLTPSPPPCILAEGGDTAVHAAAIKMRDCDKKSLGKVYKRRKHNRLMFNLCPRLSTFNDVLRRSSGRGGWGVGGGAPPPPPHFHANEKTNTNKCVPSCGSTHITH